MKKSLLNPQSRMRIILSVVPEEEKELTINNTEQDVDAYIINNDAENTDQSNDKNDKDKNPEIKPTEQPETTLLLTNDKENK